MILPDSSAWVDYLRGRSTRTADALDAAIRQGTVAMCEPVWAEVIAGARDERHHERLERALGSFDMIPTTFDDWENAATISRMTRRSGLTVRTFVDCLVAGIAVHRGATVLHNDSDYERIAALFPLLDQTRG